MASYLLRRLLPFFCMLYLTEPACTQPIPLPVYFTNFTVQNGLPDNHINHLMQDKRGFLWISTSQGLARFDGRNFINYRHSRADSSSFPANNINSSIELNNGIVLVNCGSRLWMLNTFNHHQYSPPAFWKNRLIHSVSKVYDKLVICTGSNIYITDLHLKLCDSVSNQHNKPVSAIALGKERILFHSTGFAFSFSLKNKKTESWHIKIYSKLDGNHAWMVNSVDTVNQVLYLRDFWAGVFKLPYNYQKPPQVNPIPFEHYENTGFVQQFVADNNALIVSTTACLQILKKGGLQVNYIKSNGLSGQILPGEQHGIFKDASNNYWAWGDAGLSKFNLQKPQCGFWDIPNLQQPTIAHYIKNKTGLWMTTGDGNGTYYLDSATQKMRVADTNIIRNANGIASVNNDVIVYGNGFKGNENVKLLAFKKNQDHPSASSVLKYYYGNADAVTLVYQSICGDIWYSLNKGGGLVRQAANSHQLVQFKTGQYPAAFYVGYLEHACEDALQNVYFSVNRSNRLLVWRNAAKSFETWDMDSLCHSSEKLINGIITHLIDNKNNLWVSYEQKGLLKYNLITHKADFYNIEDGVRNSSIFSMVSDEQANIWMPSAKSLDCYVAATGKFLHFTTTDGLPFDDFSGSSLFYNNIDSALYFSGPGKLYKIRTRDLLTLKSAARASLFIDAMWVNAKPFAFESSQAIHLKPSETNLQFSFALMDADGKINPDKYEYLLTEKGSGKWQQLANTNIVNFSNLRAGNYLLQARVLNEATNTYINSSNVFKFTIGAYWYTTSWFIVLSTMACLLISFMVVRSYYFRKLQQQKLILENERALEAERQRIASDMHDDVGAGLSRIRYISASLKNADTGTMDADIARIMQLSDDSVEKMNEIIWSLNQGSQMLDELIYYIRSQCGEMVYNANLDFICEPPESIPALIFGWKENRHTYLLVKEAVHNAIKHADATLVSIAIEINDFLNVEVSDNGKGFDPVELRNAGNGINNYKKRTAAISGTYKLKAAIGQGTRVTFTIPLPASPNKGYMGWSSHS